jgi:hypothetical protein
VRPRNTEPLSRPLLRREEGLSLAPSFPYKPSSISLPLFFNEHHLTGDTTMTGKERKKGRTWATDQLWTKTQSPIYAVKWYELATSNTSEIEVTARGKVFLREIANTDLEDSRRQSNLEKTIEGLVREIDEAD